MEKKLKIGILLDTTIHSNDGVQQYVRALGRWFISQGHDIKFIVTGSEDKGEFKGRILNIGKNIDIASNGNKLSPSIFPDKKSIEKILSENKFDVLHVQMPYSPMVSGTFMRKANVPVVGTFHILPKDFFVSALNKLFAIFLKNQISKIKIISVSSSAQSFVKNVYKKDSIVIPNMVDIEKYSHGQRLPEFNDEKVNILFLGRLVERKGAIYLLKAVKLLQQNGIDNFRTIIAGDGDQRSSLESFVQENNLKDIVFLGFIEEENKENIYDSSDICVFPATGGESFGIVLIEAMASGKAVVAFDNPGYKSVMTDTNNAEFLAKNKDVDSLTEKIKILIEDKTLREKTSQKNIVEAQKYSVDNVCKQVLEIYNSMLNQ